MTDGRSRWRYPDRGLEPRHLVHAGRFVDELTYRDRVVAAMVSGSRAAGLAHAQSDLDVLVVLADDEGRWRYRTWPRRYGDVTVDVETVTVPDVERHLGVLRRRERTRTLDRTLYALGDVPGWTALVRLAIGQVVTATPAARDLLARLDRDAVRRSLMVHAALCLATFVEDAQGAVECGDLATALAASQEAVRWSVELSLAALDDVYLGPKYLPRRMARHGCLGTLLDERAGELFGFPPASCPDGTAERFVRRRLLLASHLSGHALTAAWELPVGTLPPVAPDPAGLVRSPYLAPVRWPGGCGLMRGVEIVKRLSEDELLLWTLLDGRPVDQVVDDFSSRRRTDAPDGKGLLDDLLDEWRRAGVVEASPDRPGT